MLKQWKYTTQSITRLIDNLNKAIAGTDLEGKTIEEVIKEVATNQL
jgi:hypothetical protein